MAPELDPDVVVIGFAMNDSKVAGYRDKDIPGSQETVTSTERVNSLLVKTEFYKLLRYLALVIKWEPKSSGYHLKKKAGSANEKDKPVDYLELEQWTRVSPEDYEKNILEMISLVRNRDAAAVLMFNELWRGSPYRTVLEKISRSQGVPLVDSSALIAEARKRIEHELEGELDLPPSIAPQAPVDRELEVIFRAYVAELPVPKAVYIVAAHPKLGDLVPNKVRHVRRRNARRSERRRQCLELFGDLSTRRHAFFMSIPTVVKKGSGRV